MNSEAFVKEFVVGLGFLGGLWMAVGINPEAEVISALTNVMTTFTGTSNLPLLFGILSILFLVSSIVTAYSIGGYMGLASVGTAFIGGILILLSPVISIIFLIGGIVLGYMATS